MSVTGGIDIGSTYTKAVILDAAHDIVGRAVAPTGFKLTEIAETTYQSALEQAGLTREDVDYVVATGFGRHQATLSDEWSRSLSESADKVKTLGAGIAGRLEEVSHGTEDVAAAAQEIAAAAQQLNASTEEVAGSASHLADAADKLTSAVGGFRIDSNGDKPPAAR